jgi:hypothetical protein
MYIALGLYHARQSQESYRDLATLHILRTFQLLYIELAMNNFICVNEKQ